VTALCITSPKLSLRASSTTSHATRLTGAYRRERVCITGISNMVGRAVAGALAAVPRLNILHLNNVSLVVTGLSTGLVTVLCTSYASMIVYAVVYGLSVGMLHSKSKLIMSYILGGVSGQWCRQARAWARGLSPREMSLSSRRETDWSRIRR